MRLLPRTLPNAVQIIDQDNYAHPLVDAPYVYIDDYVIMQMVSGPGSVEVPLIHCLSYELPRDVVLTAFVVAVQWVRYNAHSICPTAHFVRIRSSGLTHDWMRRQLVEQMDFVAVPQPGGDFIFQYDLRVKKEQDNV